MLPFIEWGLSGKNESGNAKKIRSSRKEREVHKFLLILFRLNGDKNVFFCLSSHTYIPIRIFQHISLMSCMMTILFPCHLCRKQNRKGNQKRILCLLLHARVFKILFFLHYIYQILFGCLDKKKHTQTHKNETIDKINTK